MSKTTRAANTKLNKQRITKKLVLSKRFKPVFFILVFAVLGIYLVTQALAAR